jgi:hypothetical protein
MNVYKKQHRVAHRFWWRQLLYSYVRNVLSILFYIVPYIGYRVADRPCVAVPTVLFSDVLGCELTAGGWDRCARVVIGLHDLLLQLTTIVRYLLQKRAITMPRKPTDPRPDRRYAPLSIDMRLDWLRSASAVVGVPGLSVLPGNLAAIFADAVRKLHDEAGVRQAESQATTSSEGAPIPPDPTIQAREGGGFMTNPGGTVEADAPALTTARPTLTIALSTSDERIQFSQPAPSPASGGAMRGRGGSGGPSGRSPSSGAAQPLSGRSGASGFFGVGSASGGGQSSMPVSGRARNSNANNTPVPSGQAGQSPAAPSTQPSAPNPANLPANPSKQNSASQPAAPSNGLQASSASANGISQLAGLAGSSSAKTSFGIGGSGNSLTTIGSFALDTTSLAQSPSSSSSPSQTESSSSTPGSSQSSGTIAASGGGVGTAATVIAPIGGGNGGIFAQAWRYQQSPPDSAPYSSGPVSDNTAAAPFNTLNSLILSYIDSALSNIVATNTSGSNVATKPAGLTITSTDGLGTYTFSASGSYNIDGQYISGSFSTTDNATLSYSFHEVGYTPDGDQFTLNDAGGATLNVRADNGTTATHSLTNTLTGSDSYALIQVLNQSDALAGSYTSAESSTESLGGSDSFTLNET